MGPSNKVVPIFKEKEELFLLDLKKKCIKYLIKLLIKKHIYYKYNLILFLLYS